MLSVVFHPKYDAQFPASHRFPMSKYSILARTLKQSVYQSRLKWHTPPFPKAAIFDQAHDADYVRQVYELSVPIMVEKQIGFSVTEAVAHRALFATSGTLLAAELALKEGIAGNLAGGSHHAQFLHGAGFCTFNDVAVTAIRLLQNQQIKNAIILDLDVHQGDGTASILKDWPQLKTISLHCVQNYPFEKARSDIDIGFEKGTKNEEYLDVLHYVLEEHIISQRPDIVFYNAGVDVHKLDRLGKLMLDDDGLFAREKMVLEALYKEQIPVCIVIGGGYSKNIDQLALHHGMVFDVAQALTCDQIGASVGKSV